ncbi:MAG: hypothetical protein U5K69_18845 [Balneolaceae bacterium]|nr:hypothetical protein [Balneolaceae bacterium]
MFFKKLKNKISSCYKNFFGWRTGRKIIVIESDDWGGIRTPSLRVLKELSKMDIEIERDHYLTYDSLASEEDLDALFSVLRSKKNRKGETPIITANVIMGNPDFKKIKSNEFQLYDYELFTDTLKRYPEHSKSFDLWKNGIRESLFHPQFHGREHLQVFRWLKNLNVKNSETRRVFDLELFGISTNVTKEDRKSYMAAYEWDDESQKKFIINAITDGLEQFKKIFGFKSLSTIAPNYVWHQELENVFYKGGVRYIQGASVQKIPRIDKDVSTYKRHFTGETNDLGQVYLIRNCRFEPSSNNDKDWVSSCLAEINLAFRMKKPAIIDTHRVNYIGYINPKNRYRGLRALNELLGKIISKWPDVEFMTSDQLGRLIENDIN